MMGSFDGEGGEFFFGVSVWKEGPIEQEYEDEGQDGYNKGLEQHGCYIWH